MNADLMVWLIAAAALAAVGLLAAAVVYWRGTMPSPPEGQLDLVIRALANANPGFVPLHPYPEVLPATDEALCEAWCSSYRALRAAASRQRILRIVEERGGHLDEMERRNPEAFAAWLASGATASDNPLPYLSLAHVERPAINWDELIDGEDH
jgi:hypothetical protein